MSVCLLSVCLDTILFLADIGHLFSDYSSPWGLKPHLLAKNDSHSFHLHTFACKTVNVPCFGTGRTHIQTATGTNNPSVICNYFQFKWKVDKKWTSVKFNFTSALLKIIHLSHIVSHSWSLFAPIHNKCQSKNKSGQVGVQDWVEVDQTWNYVKLELIRKLLKSRRFEHYSNSVVWTFVMGHIRTH